MTRRGLIRLLTAAAAGAQKAWLKPILELKREERVLHDCRIFLQPRSMFFTLRFPLVQILCSVGDLASGGEIKAVRVNDEIIPRLSKSPAAGSYWQRTNADLLIYVKESVVHFDLSRFPDVEVVFTETDPGRRWRRADIGRSTLTVT